MATSDKCLKYKEIARQRNNYTSSKKPRKASGPPAAESDEIHRTCKSKRALNECPGKFQLNRPFFKEFSGDLHGFADCFCYDESIVIFKAPYDWI
mmetsp:Transcript_1691/g.3233  ORF Transcript_1691/g.3233 Transcript_1691/m.3233 type:complete len:95 (+) Transcript_1691:207-491(+)